LSRFIRKWADPIQNFSVPKTCSTVQRLEGQLRRPVLKELGVSSVDELLANLDGLWAYCFQLAGDN
jgi:hypothetical protein